jgi:hypothetical protein
MIGSILKCGLLLTLLILPTPELNSKETGQSAENKFTVQVIIFCKKLHV